MVTFLRDGCAKGWKQRDVQHQIHGYFLDEADLAIHGIAITCCRCTGAKDGRDDQVGNWVSFLVIYVTIFINCLQNDG